MTTATDAYPHYAAAYTAQPADVPPALMVLRSRGWDAFSRLGLPTARRGNEPWKYTNVAPIAREAFANPKPLDVDARPISLDQLRDVAPWHEDWFTLVFVDGVFAPALSGGPAAPSYAARFSQLADDSNAGRLSLLGELAPPHDDGFVALNTAFVSDGVIVDVPVGGDGGVVNLVYLTTDREQPRVTHPRILISAQRQARATVIETYCGPDDTRYFTNAVAEIHVHEGASVEHYRLLLDGLDAYHVGTSRVVQHRDSSFSSVAIARGAALGRNDFGVTMVGAGAECTLNGLYLTTGNQHMDNYINIDHTEPHGTSRLFYKGILDGRSRGGVRGQRNGPEGRPEDRRPADGQEPVAVGACGGGQQAEPAHLRRRREVRTRGDRRAHRPGHGFLHEEPGVGPAHRQPDSGSRLCQRNHRYGAPCTAAGLS